MTWAERYQQQELYRLQAKSKEELIAEIFMLRDALRKQKGKSLKIVNKHSNWFKGYSEAAKADKEKLYKRSAPIAQRLHKEAESFIQSVFDDTLKTLQARKSEEE